MSRPPRDPALVATYRALTRLYPKAFRSEYRDDLVQLLRDQCRDEPAARAGARAALDLAITIPTQHLEARMDRTSKPTVPLLFTALAAAGLILALLGGTEPVSLIVGLTVAAVAGALAVVAWRRTEPTAASGQALAMWWKLLIAGPAVLVVGAVQAQLEVGSWYVWILMVLTALVLTALGLVLGVAALLTHRPHSTAA